MSEASRASENCRSETLTVMCNDSCGKALCSHSRQLSARLQREPMPDGNQNPGILCDFNEPIRRDQPVRGMFPSQQRFESADRARIQSHHRLVINAELSC